MNNDLYNIIISIKPAYADMILDGRKKYEFRKCSFAKRVDKVFIYSTKPVKEITGYFTFDEVLRGKKSEIWDLCSEFGGMSECDFFEYFDGKSVAYAMKIEKVYRLENPINPYCSIKEFKAPRSFVYLNYEIGEGSIL